MTKKYFDNKLSDKDFYLNILKNEPRDYEANLKIGLIYVQENNFLDAKKQFELLITINKLRYEAHLNLSNIYFMENNELKSNNILKNYLTNISENLEIINALSINLLNTKKYDQLDNHINKYLYKYSSHILFYIKGYLLIKQNKISESEKYLKSSIEINPNFWQTYEILLKQYEKQSRLEELSNLINKAKHFFEDTIYFSYFYSLYLYRIKEYKKCLQILNNKNLLERFSKLENKIYLADYFDLVSKVCEKLEQYGKSYDYAIKRNNVNLNLDQNKKFNKDLILNTIKSYQNFFETQKKPSLKQIDKGLNHSNLTFLIGFPRSGTTLLDTILRSHSKTLVLEEKPYLLDVRHEFYRQNKIDNLLSIDKKYRIELQQMYFNSFNFEKNKIIIDKYPLNLIELGFIKTIFPNSKIILAIRHPLDCIISCVLTAFKINDGMTQFENLQTTSLFYNECFKLFLNYLNFFHIDHHIVKYEEVVLNFEKEISQLLNYLELSFENNIYNFQKTAKKREKINTPSYSQVVQPLYSSSIGRYKKFEEVNEIKSVTDYWVKYFSYNV
tara:strand:+ start:3345 stop:5015 length:1671 start_codon:yes stop_codon:yes gene_type:complete